jgi:hypothetical protein
MTKEYSKLVASTRPNSATPNGEKYQGENTPTMGLAGVTRPARARIAKEIVTPRTRAQLHELWGRTLDPKFTESTLAWLAKASKEEKQQFKNAIASHPKVSTGGVLGATSNPYTRSATPSQGLRRPPRPQSAPLLRPGSNAQERTNPFRPPAITEDSENQRPYLGGKREEYRRASFSFYVLQCLWAVSGIIRQADVLT